MNKLVPLIILLFMTMPAATQKNYTVIYRLKMNVDATGKSTAPELLGALHVLGDTMTVFRFAPTENELMNKLDLNNRDAYHSPVSLMKDGDYYEIISLQKEDYYIKQPKDTTKWEIMPNDTMTILNIKCFAAKSAGMVVWYAPSMPQKSGPSGYYGLPGLVLAVFNSNFHNLYTAEKFIPTVPEIVTLGNPALLSWEAFQEMKKKQVNPHGNYFRKKNIPIF